MRFGACTKSSSSITECGSSPMTAQNLQKSSFQDNVLEECTVVAFPRYESSVHFQHVQCCDTLIQTLQQQLEVE